MTVILSCILNILPIMLVILWIPFKSFVLAGIYPVWGFPLSSVGKESACNAGDPGSIRGSGRYPAEGNGNPLQYSCLENPTAGRAWRATDHKVAKSRT